MKLDIIFILFIINVIVNILILTGVYALRDELKNSKEIKPEEKAKVFAKAIDSAIRPSFLPIQSNRPTDGSHIFVWDCVDKRAIPTVYKGNEEAWKASKDKETRFTHFIELNPPS